MRKFVALLLLSGASLVGAQYNNQQYPQGLQPANNNNANGNGNYPQNLQPVNNRNQNGQNLVGQVQNQNNNPQFQSQQQQYQSQPQNGQQYQRPNGFVNTVPLNTGPGDQQNQTGAVITLQLKSYSNPTLKLPGGMTCSCPSGLSCPYLRTTGPQCYFSFTTIVSAPDMSVQYIATEFVPLDYNGNVDLTRSTSNWTAPQTLYLTSTPTAIDIFVHHLGVVINQQSANLMFFNNLVHVDTFVQPLNTVVPGLPNQNSGLTSVTLTGQMLQTTLSLAFSVNCRGGFIGPSCDLICTPVQNTQYSSCQSSRTGLNYTCSQSGQQVNNCQLCQGVISNGQCSGTNYITNASAGMDSSSFKTWTIVLGCLFGLALIFIIALIVFICVTHSREPAPAYRAPPPPTNTWSKPAAARPLLSDPYPSKADQNSQDWGYQPHVVSVNNQRAAPIADHEASRHSQSTNDDQNSHSSYPPSNNRPANGNPVALARREAQV